MGNIFYVMGKSSSGKDTIYKKIKEAMPELKGIVLYTTRPIRAGETQGVEYFFVNDDNVKELDETGKIIESRTYNTIHGPWSYLTVDDGQVDLHQDSYLVIGTLESYEKMQKYYGKDAVVPIYIEVEDGERLSRALDREREQKEPKYAELCRRFLADSQDFAEENIQRLGINKRFQNIKMNQVVAQIMLYIREKL